MNKKKLNCILIESSKSLGFAIKKLDSTGIGIILVTNKSKKLIGTITDGDIRRAILKNTPFNEDIKNIMHHNPISVTENISKAHMLRIIKKNNILHLPVLNSSGKVIDLETLQSLLGKKTELPKVLIMAGGFGKRLKPITNKKPKPLLKIGSKTILELLIKKLTSLGFSEFFLSVHYKHEMIKKYFGDGKKIGCKIHYLFEDVPLGTAGSLGLLGRLKVDENLLILNSDLVTDVNFIELLQFHDFHQNDATMCVKQYTHTVPYGIVNHSNFELKEVIEKPEYNFFINAGIYILSSKIVNKVKNPKYMDMPELLLKYTKNKKIFVFPIHENWIDIGRIDDYKKAKSIAKKK